MWVVPTSTVIQHLLTAHLAEEVRDTGEDNQENTTTGTEPQYLGQETLVESAEALLLHDRAKSGPCPVVLGGLASDLGRVLNARLDNVHGGVKDSTDSATDGSADEVVCDLSLLGGSNRQHGADAVNATEVTSVPQDVAPHGGLETLVEGERALLPHNLAEAVGHARVLVCLCLVLETNLDQLKGDNNKRLGGSGGSTGENRERLGLLFYAKEVAVESSPGVVGRELGGPIYLSTALLSRDYSATSWAPPSRSAR